MRAAPVRFRLGLALCCLVSLFVADERVRADEAVEDRPNVILLITDDQRWDTLGCTGNPVIQTPHLDALAADGVLFTNSFVTTSLCTPSRASILTGMYARQHRIYDLATPLPRYIQKYSYPALLGHAGYHTGFIGKWGLPVDMERKRARPWRLFDHWGGVLPGELDYFQSRTDEGEPITKAFTRRAVEYLQERAQGQEPFCLTLSFKAPHEPFGWFDPALKDLYEDDALPVPETANPEAMAALPAFLQNTLLATKGESFATDHELLQRAQRAYYRLITGVDIAVGTIRAALEEAGLADDTVIVFTSDNGMLFGERGLKGKWLMYEESIRVPLIVYDPRQPESLRGRPCEQTALNIDLGPTVLDLAGLDAPGPSEGRSLLPLLAGETPEWRDDWFYECLYEHGGTLPAVEGVRTDRWKYVRYVGQDPVHEELYDLVRDPLERRSVAAEPEHAEILDHLRGRHEAYVAHLSRSQGRAIEANAVDAASPARPAETIHQPRD